jgi:hypothetical protein
MKQLSLLLLLAGLTTGCFAADQEQRKSCWELVNMLRNAEFRATIESTSANVDALKIPGMEDCINNYDQLAELSNRRDIDPADLEILFAIRGRLAERWGLARLTSPTYLSLEEAIADENAIQAFLKGTQYVEIKEIDKKASETPKAINLDSSSRVNQEIVKTRAS